jgi:hypothetical protein
VAGGIALMSLQSRGAERRRLMRAASAKNARVCRRL